MAGIIGTGGVAPEIARVAEDRAAASCRLVESLLSGSPRTACLISDPDALLGFRVDDLGFEYQDGVPTTDGLAPSNIKIDPDLLATLGTVKDRRITLVCEIPSAALGRKVRVAVILPKAFDPKRERPYGVYGFIPKGTTIAARAGSGMKQIEDFVSRRGWSQSILVLPELLSEEKDGLRGRDLQLRYLSLLLKDAFPYVCEQFRGVVTAGRTAASSPVFLLPFLEGVALPSQASEGAPRIPPPPSMPPPPTVPPSRPYTPYAPHTPYVAVSLKQQLEKTRDPVLIPGISSYKVVSVKERDRSLGGSLGARPPPSRTELQQIAGFTQPVVVLPRLRSATLKKDVDYAILLPAGFDPSRKEGYPIVAATLPPDASFDEFVERLALEGAPFRADAIVVTLDPKASRSICESEIFERLDGSYGIDFSRYQVLSLGSDPSSWREAIANGEAEAERLSGPTVCMGPGLWRQLLPSTDDKKTFPEVGAVKKTEPIPVEMQKMRSDRGAFFATAFRSEEIESTMRLGVYLPPGYDPASDEKYPVLVLLPGRKMMLNQWTAHGQIIRKLDRMMSGDAQKMIVVIPDNTDSHFVNSKRNYMNLVTQEIVDYATRSLKGDPEKLSLAGISRGGLGVMLAGIAEPGKFKSLASLSGVLSLARHSVEKMDGPDELLEGEHDPLRRLASTHGFGAHPPRIYIDVGAQDHQVGEDAVEFSSALSRLGVEHTFRCLDPEHGIAEHNWSHWGAMFEEWIAWHQEIYGHPGQPADPFKGADKSARSLERSRDGLNVDAEAEDTKRDPKTDAKAAKIATAAYRQQLTHLLKTCVKPLASDLARMRKGELSTAAWSSETRVPKRVEIFYDVGSGVGYTNVQGRIRRNGSWEELDEWKEWQVSAVMAAHLKSEARR